MTELTAAYVLGFFCGFFMGLMVARFTAAYVNWRRSFRPKGANNTRGTH
jgi:hypothetical protein